MRTKPINVPDDWQTMPIHPLAELIEFGLGIDLEALTAHMQNQGYDDQEPIILIWCAERNRMELLDGRHRRAGAIAAEVEPTFRLFIGGDPKPYIRKKVLRQHLDSSQRAMIAAALVDTTHGGPRQGLESKSQNNDLPPEQPQMTREQAAKALNVSVSTIDHARIVQEKGSKKLQRAVRMGKASASEASDFADKLDHDDQDKIVDHFMLKGSKNLTVAAIELGFVARKVRATNRNRRRQERKAGGELINPRTGIPTIDAFNVAMVDLENQFAVLWKYWRQKNANGDYIADLTVQGMQRRLADFAADVREWHKRKTVEADKERRGY